MGWGYAIDYDKETKPMNRYRITCRDVENDVTERALVRAEDKNAALDRFYDEDPGRGEYELVKVERVLPKNLETSR